MSSYPAYRYHRSGASKTVRSAAEEPNGPDWSDKPFPPVAKKPPETVESLKAELAQTQAELETARKALADAQAEKDRIVRKFDENWKKLKAERDGLLQTRQPKGKAKGKAEPEVAPETPAE